jgi:cell division transport system ATP-binding protein
MGCESGAWGNVHARSLISAPMSRNPDAHPRAIGHGAPPTPVVLFHGVSARLDAEGRSLQDLSFAIAPGSAHVLAGAPGSGKSALIDLILAAARPERGTIQLFGHDTAAIRRRDRPALRRRIGVMFQDLRLLEGLSAFDNAALAPRTSGLAPADYRDDVAEALAWVGLGDRMGVAAGDLGDRDRRRLALARAVMGRPELLIADEPTGGLDQAASLGLLRRLAELNRAGTALLIATSNEAMAEETDAPVIALERGRMRRANASLRAPAA